MANIVFMGTSDFAVPTLDLINKHFNISAVVTTPDREKGRGQKLQYSPVKQKAIELELPVIQYENLKDPNFIEDLKKLNADIFCVVAFRILPEEVFTLPKICSFNIHGSLLPKYRGAAPINRAIMAGEKETGLTSFILQKTVDTGNILLRKHTKITDDMSAGDLHDILAPLSAELAVETINLILSGNYTPEPQNSTVATSAPKIFRDDCKINFNQEAQNVHNQIRGLSPYPSAFINLNAKEIKIIKSEILKSKNISASEYKIDKDFIIGTMDFDIKILNLKPEGKGIMKIEDFIRGYRGPKEGIIK